MAFSVEDAKKKLAELKKKNGGGDFLQWQDGPNNIRILCDEELDWYVEVDLHYFKVGKDTIAVVCNKAYDGSECFFCDMVEGLYGTKNKADKDLAGKLRAKTRFYSNVIDRDNDNKVKVAQYGPQVLEGILKYFSHIDYQDDLFDAEKGFNYDFIVTKTGEKLDTEYSVEARKNPSKLGIKLEDVKLSDLNALAYSEVFTAKEQERLLDGESKEDILKERKGEEEKTAKKSTLKKDAKKEKEEEPEQKKLVRKPKIDPEEKYALYIERLPLDVPKVKKLYASWLEEDGTEEGILALVEKYGDDLEEETETETEAKNAEGGDSEEELEKEMQAALERFKSKDAGKKKK